MQPSTSTAQELIWPFLFLAIFVNQDHQKLLAFTVSDSILSHLPSGYGEAQVLCHNILSMHVNDLLSHRTPCWTMTLMTLRQLSLVRGIAKYTNCLKGTCLPWWEINLMKIDGPPPSNKFREVIDLKHKASPNFLDRLLYFAFLYPRKINNA